jgi:ABC-type sugar transport system ATPase subunit
MKPKSGKPLTQFETPAEGVKEAGHGQKRLVAKRIAKRFGKNEALSDVSLEVSEGEFCVLLGPSGCGKSTLLRIIAGLERPSAGKIFIDGSDVTDLPPGKRDVAMVFQNYAIYPHMTVFDNIAFPLRVRKSPKEEIAARVHEAAVLLQLDQYLERKPAQLSGGERQRVAMGRAIVRQPRIFLFDEPLSNLDAKLRANMRIEISQLHRRLGATTVYVTHDQVEAMTMADTIVVLDAGIVQQMGAPRDIYQHPSNLMVAEFVGTPAMNFLPGKLARLSDETVLFTSQSLSFAIPHCHAEGEAVAGIRPEHVSIDPEGELKGKVRLVEDSGSDKFAYVELATGRQIIARLSQSQEAGIGQTVGLSIDHSRVNVFRQGNRIL